MNSKVVLITGASRGIGRAAAELFAKNGYTTVINYHKSEEAALRLAESLTGQGCDAYAVRADVSDIEAVTAMVARVLSEHGQVDVLINNAGIAQQKLFTDITPAEWARMFDIDVTGVFHCCKSVLPAMIRRHSGKIINVSSIWGICGASCEVHYSAAKAAVIGLTKALAKEVGPSNITVNCVAPGVVDTQMNGALSPSDMAALCDETPIGRIGTPLEIAQTMLFLASPAADFITGQVISPNGGFVI